MSNEHAKIEVRDLRDGDWVWANKEVLFSGLSDSAFRVYCALGAFAGNVDQRSWPSFATIASRINSSKSTVVRAMKMLEACELVKVDRRDGTSNLYTLLPVNGGISIKAPTRAQSEHHRLVRFFDDAVKKARGVKVTWTGKDLAALKRVLKEGHLSEQEIEQLMVYFLMSPGLKKFSPTMSVLFSGGILTGLMNEMKNGEEFWKNLDRYSTQIYTDKPEAVAFDMSAIQALVDKMSMKS